MIRTLLLTLGFAILLAGTAAAEDAATRGRAHRTALAEGRKHLEAGRFEDAHAAFGRWGHTMSSDLLRRISEADRKNQSGPALALRRAWLDYFPFGFLSWSTQARYWNKVAFEYLDLIEAGEAEKDESAIPLLVERIGATEHYRTLDVYMTALKEIGSEKSVAHLKLYASIEKSNHGRVARKVLGLSGD